MRPRSKAILKANAPIEYNSELKVKNSFENYEARRQFTALHLFACACNAVKFH
jgi:hypothetical protein